MQEGPKGAVVLIIRHAEDAGTGRGLSPRGQQRAEAYKDYFKNFTVDSKRLCPDAIFVAKDSKKSHRPRLTVEPFAKAERLRIDTRLLAPPLRPSPPSRARSKSRRLIAAW
jgi:hypothetical protein